MRAAKLDLHALQDVSWWHWAATVPLLAGHLAGMPGCLAAAMVLCALMAVYFMAQVRGVRSMPVQVRLAYLALLLAGTLPAMAWVYWVQLVGTSAMVLVGYCPLVRTLTLLPWNRSEAINRPWLRNLALAPARGGLWDWSVGQSPPAAACSCSVRWVTEPAQSP